MVDRSQLPTPLAVPVMGADHDQVCVGPRTQQHPRGTNGSG